MRGGSVKLTSSNAKVVRIDGLDIIAIAPGTATVTYATVDGGASVDVAITVPGDADDDEGNQPTENRPTEEPAPPTTPTVQPTTPPTQPKEPRLPPEPTETTTTTTQPTSPPERPESPTGPDVAIEIMRPSGADNPTQPTDHGDNSSVINKKDEEENMKNEWSPETDAQDVDRNAENREEEGLNGDEDTPTASGLTAEQWRHVFLVSVVLGFVIWIAGSIHNKFGRDEDAEG